MNRLQRLRSSIESSRQMVQQKQSRTVRASGRAPCEHGFAIVLVMWLVAGLTVLVSAMVGVNRSDLKGVFNQRLFAEHAALGDAAINITLASLLTDPIGEAPLGLQATIGDKQIRVEAVISAAYVNLNLASEELLRDTLVFGGGLAPELAESIAQRIVDWRDPDDVALPGGAEEPAYEAAGTSFRPRNGPFESVEDLIQVLGVSLDLHDRLRNLFTTYGFAPGVDPRFAPEGVLKVLAAGNMSPVNALLNRRETDDPLMDMTEFDSRHIGTGTPEILRLEAVREVDGIRLSRVRWVDFSQMDHSGVPWRDLATEPVRSLAIAEMEDGIRDR